MDIFTFMLKLSRTEIPTVKNAKMRFYFVICDRTQASVINVTFMVNPLTVTQTYGFLAQMELGCLSLQRNCVQ